MPTCGRVFYDNCICHIVQRGNNRQLLFRESGDYKKFLLLFREYRSRYGFELYNYCFMPNHIHLLMKIMKKEDLPKLMQGIFQSFRFYIRRKYDYVGYLYQGRYRNRLIESNSYLLECARYIERNPLRAKIVEDLSLYEWSSYSYYAYAHKNDIITENPLFSTLGANSVMRKEVYIQYVLPSRPYEEMVDKGFGI